MNEDLNIPHSPRLIIKSMGSLNKYVWDLDQARERLNFKSGIVMVDGKRLRSFDELLELVTHDNYANKDFVEVVLLLTIAGG